MAMTPFAWEAVAAGMDRVDELQDYHEKDAEDLGLARLQLDGYDRSLSHRLLERLLTASV